MSSVSSATSGLIQFRDADPSAKLTDPAEALQRLRLRDGAGRDWREILQLSSVDLSRVVRTIDAERQALDQSYTHGTEAGNVLKEAEDLLTEATALAKSNAKSGIARQEQRQNQTKIDDLLSQIESSLGNARSLGARLFDGKIALTAGQPSPQAATMKIPPLDLKELGEVRTSGRVLTLADVVTRGALDTARGRGTAARAAVRSLDSATKTIKALREQIATFQTDELRPRLGDVATAIEGLYGAKAGELAGREQTLELARDLRRMMLASATLAVSVGAEGWDRERILELLT